MRFKETNSEGYFEHPVVITDHTIMSVASEMLSRKSSLLKKYDLSFQQYIILKTLYFSDGEAASIKSLTEEMLDKMSNTSRLVSKLEKKNFLERKISTTDRRQVDVFITKKGKQTFAEAAVKVNEAIISAFEPLDKIELANLLQSLLKLKSV